MVSKDANESLGFMTEIQQIKNISDPEEREAAIRKFNATSLREFISENDLHATEGEDILREYEAASDSTQRDITEKKLFFYRLKYQIILPGLGGIMALIIVFLLYYYDSPILDFLTG